jgi:hypothetical protein
MAMFQIHISRVVSLIDDLKSGVEIFQYVTSWDDPLLTAVSLFFFVRLVWVFDPAYIGSFPIFLIILWMIYLAGARSFGKLKLKYIQKEIERNQKVNSCKRFVLCLTRFWVSPHESFPYACKDAECYS